MPGDELFINEASGVMSQCDRSPYHTLILPFFFTFYLSFRGYTNNVPTWAWTRFIKPRVCIIPHQYNAYTINRCEHMHVWTSVRRVFLLSTPSVSFCPKQTILTYTPVCVMSLTAHWQSSVDSALLSLWLPVLYCKEFYCGKAALNYEIPVTNAAYCVQ